jgi:hypothetical protein
VIEVLLARPDWSTTLAGVVPALRAGGDLSPKARRLVEFLADDIENELNSQRETAAFRETGKVPEASLREYLIRAITVGGHHGEVDEELTTIAQELRNVAIRGTFDASQSSTFLVLQRAAGFAFGSPRTNETVQGAQSSLVLGHPSVGELEQYASGVVTATISEHLALCQRCHDVVERCKLAS